jgi:hypothetical protein
MVLSTAAVALAGVAGAWRALRPLPPDGVAKEPAP